MLLKNKIDKKFRLNKNFNGDQYLGFEFYKDHNSNNYRIFNADNALDALALISEQNRNDTPENLEERFSNWFNIHIDNQTKYEGVCELIAVEGRYDNPLELFEMRRYEEWATVFFNYLSDNNFIRSIKYEKFTLALCWAGAEKINFKGRNAFEILKSFAINHRKRSSDLEAHRHGLKTFIQNFKRDMIKYFGFDWGCDENFLDILLALKIFKKESEGHNEAVL